MMKKKPKKQYRSNVSYPAYADAGMTRRNAAKMLVAGAASALMMKACGGIAAVPEYHYVRFPEEPNTLSSVLSTGETVTYYFFVEHESQSLADMLTYDRDAVIAELDALFLTLTSDELVNETTQNELESLIAEKLEQICVDRYGNDANIGWMSLELHLILE